MAAIGYAPEGDAQDYGSTTSPSSLPGGHTVQELRTVWSRGIMDLQMGRAEAAAEKFAFVEQRPVERGVLAELLEERARYYFGLRRSEQASADRKRALALFNEELAEHPEQTGPYLKFAQYLQKLGQPRRAVMILTQGVRRLPEETTLLMARARLQQRLGRRGQALTDVDAVLELEPTSYDAAALRKALLGE